MPGGRVISARDTRRTLLNAVEKVSYSVDFDALGSLILQCLDMLDVDVVIVISEPNSCSGYVWWERFYYHSAPSSVRLLGQPLWALADVLGETRDYVVQLQE